MPETLEMCHDSTRAGQDAVGSAGRMDATTSSRRNVFSIYQGRRWRDTSKRRRLSSFASICLIVLICLNWISPAAAALLNFDNCLSKSILDSSPLTLQYVPLDVNVWFNLSDPLHPLNVTVYGNVSGTADQAADYPSMDDPSWNNPNDTEGKIVNLDAANNKYSTLLTTFDVLSFVPFNNASQFCASLVQGDCPLGPVFNYNL